MTAHSGCFHLKDCVVVSLTLRLWRVHGLIHAYLPKVIILPSSLHPMEPIVFSTLLLHQSHNNQVKSPSSIPNLRLNLPVKFTSRMIPPRQSSKRPGHLIKHHRLVMFTSTCFATVRGPTNKGGIAVAYWPQLPGVSSTDIITAAWPVDPLYNITVDELLAISECLAIAGGKFANLPNSVRQLTSRL